MKYKINKYVATDKIIALINNRAIKAERGDRLLLNDDEAKVIHNFIIKLEGNEK